MSSILFGSLLNFKGNLFIRFENVSLATFEESSNTLLFIDFFLLDKSKNNNLNIY